MGHRCIECGFECDCVYDEADCITCLECQDFCEYYNGIDIMEG